ncbi:hypothetical protein LTR56_015868 [Elasticomyces elasticus]|nr:hypothetical protein LTR56_015868 [Elasticomyces elasticus]KAK3640030.1 hypothetical protein LTR22_017188 [Elasticomyces elasticus]KAK4908220.1 hypothetical protein LTR49_022865 [Elasticomyces elasticus]KAK5754985.1 hypothetical protein LTS12_014901 [Elasticomyces elasticus]
MFGSGSVVNGRDDGGEKPWGQSDGGGDHSQQHQLPLDAARKRVKVTRACDACRSKKKRCSGQVPCAPCRRSQATCTYDTIYLRGTAAPPSPAASASTTTTLNSQRLPYGETGPPHVPDTIQLQSPRPVQTLSNDHRSPVGRSTLQSTESSTYQTSRRTSPEPAAVTNVDGNYHGPTSAHSFLGRAWKRFDRGRSQSGISTPHENATSSLKSIFSFGDRSVPEVDAAAFSWPHPAVARELLQRYFDFSAPTYRVLHQSTVASWLIRIQEEKEGAQASLSYPSAAAQAALLMVFATSSMFKVDMANNVCDADSRGWQDSELYYLVAQGLLNSEVGPPRLESVQARFMTVLYLLSSSRANKAWFTHGVTVQLIMALGLHRKRPLAGDGKALDNVSSECQKRVLWCSYTVDKYLSVIMGRPRLLQDEDIDQDYPLRVNDEDLSGQAINLRPARDCTMDAPIFHARLARILARAAREQYAIQQLSDQQQIDVSIARSEEIAKWHQDLPPFISGAVQAGTLVPVFRRQLTVLRLAHYHITMFVTRPLLLRDYAKSLQPDYALRYRHQLRDCVLAAKDATDLVLSFVQDGQLFPAFWYTQYIAFNAISIIYIYMIQAMEKRIPARILCAVDEQPFVIDDQALFQLAESAQTHLAKATVRNAPAWRYSVILDGLRCEVTGSVARSRAQSPSGTQQHGGPMNGPLSAASGLEPKQPVTNNPAQSHGSLSSLDSDMRSLSAYYPSDYSGTGGGTSDGTYTQSNLFDPQAEKLLEGLSNNMGEAEFGIEFWSQFDSLPLSYIDPGMMDDMSLMARV